MPPADEAGAGEARRGVAWRTLHAEAVERLSTAGVDEPEVSARRIVEECSGYEGASWLLGLDELVTERGVAAFDRLVARRLMGEPIQYVVGRWGFRSLDLFVDRRVLIPRPETEMVAGLAVDALRAAAAAGPAPIAVDLGTGSGAIGLSLAVEVGGAEVWMSDRSPDALAVARANLAGLGMAGGRVRVVGGSWFDALPGDLQGRVAVIAANPPYIAHAEALDPSVAEWEPAEALISGGRDGTDDLRHLVTGAPAWLADDGVLVLEMATPQTTLIASLAEQHFDAVGIEPDLAGRPRAVVARRPRR